jgi:hypothetical protein
MDLSTALWVVAMVASAPQAPSTAERVDSFLVDFQDAVGRRDKKAVAALLQYPAAVRVTGMEVPLEGAAAFIKLYDAVFTPELEEILALSGLPAAGKPRPKYPITITPDGLSIGNGAIRALKAGNSYRITRILVPSSSANRGLQHPPIRVVLYQGHTAAQFSGLLMQRDEVQPYVVRAAKGRLLEATIDKFRARDVSVRVVDATGQPLAARSREGARTWSGVVPEDGEYRVEVVRAAPAETGTLSYTLAIKVR